jgi:RES domain-containing protein
LSIGIAYHDKLYRALNPVWARQPLSGEGAARFGGRFNAVGTPALYCSLSPLTALREANQVGDLQPTVLVAYNAEIDRVFDGRSLEGLAKFGMTTELLADPAWRDAVAASGSARTQIFAASLIEKTYNGLLVPSFARGAGADDLNLVLWRWSAKAPSRIELIDDENRLMR